MFGAALRGLPPDSRVPLAAMAGLGVVLFVWGLPWGMPDFHGWAPDELDADLLLTAIGRRFAHGWFELYPPLHFMLLAPAAIPFYLLQDHLAGDGALVAVTALHAVMRLVSVGMAAGLVVILYRMAVETTTGLAASLACLLFIGCPTVIYYAKTANVDMP